MVDWLIVVGSEAVNREESLVGVEGKVSAVVVGEIDGLSAIADDEQLHEAEECAGVSVARIVLVVDDLLHGATWINTEGLELDLDDRDAVD